MLIHIETEQEGEQCRGRVELTGDVDALVTALVASGNKNEDLKVAIIKAACFFKIYERVFVNQEQIPKD